MPVIPQAVRTLAGCSSLAPVQRGGGRCIPALAGLNCDQTLCACNQPILGGRVRVGMWACGAATLHSCRGLCGRS